MGNATENETGNATGNEMGLFHKYKTVDDRRFHTYETGNETEGAAAMFHNPGFLNTAIRPFLIGCYLKESLAIESLKAIREEWTNI